MRSTKKTIISLAIAIAFSISANAENQKVKVSAPELMGKQEQSKSPEKKSEIKTESKIDKSLEKKASPVDFIMPNDTAPAITNPLLDSKMTTYEFDPNSSYHIFAKSGLLTQIDAPEGYKINGFYLSDTDEDKWSFNVSKDKKHVFIKPNMPGLYNSASLVVAEGDISIVITIESVESGEWYQRVKWNIPKYLQKKLKQAKPSTVNSEKSGEEKQSFYEDYSKSDQTEPSVYKKTGVNVLNVNSKWKIEGNASFKPSSVYDDGKFTYIIFPKNIPELPTIFNINEEGDSEIVNYIVKKSDPDTDETRDDITNVIVVQKVMNEGLLKIGKSEVKIKNQKASSSKGFWSSWFKGSAESDSDKQVKSPLINQ